MDNEQHSVLRITGTAIARTAGRKFVFAELKVRDVLGASAD